MSRQSELAQLGRVFDNSALSNRNLIINGAMQVAQRGTSFSVGGFTLDRWYANAVFSVTQYTDASGQMWLDYTNNEGSWANVSQKIEDGLYRVRNKTITLSFDWEQVTAGPTAEARFYNNVDLDTYVAIPNPSVAERKTITVDIGNVGNGAGGWLGVAFYNSKSVAGSGRFRLSNVQLEVGDTATPFEHRSYGQELALCQRYYHNTYSSINGVMVGYTGYVPTTSNRAYRVGIQHPVTMRTAPSISMFGVVRIWDGTTTSPYSSAVTIFANNKTVDFDAITATDLNDNRPCRFYQPSTADYIAFDAEI